MKKSTQTPVLNGQPPKKRGRPRKISSPNAVQIAASMEAEAQRLLDFAKILRGSAPK